jgi:DNA helicase-2/ATP-dependent DNA helicase PcrA
MIIGPNRFFLNYISDVLPDLGVEEVKQITFIEFAQNFINENLKIVDQNQKLSQILENKLNFDKEQKVSNFKSSLIFKDLIDKYIDDICINFIPNKDFNIGKHIILTYKEINSLFLDTYKDKSIEDRLFEIRKHISNAVISRKTELLEKLEEFRKRKLFKLELSKINENEKQDMKIEIIDRIAYIRKKIENNGEDYINEYFDLLKIPSCIESYSKFYNSLKSNELLEISDQKINSLNNRIVELEDIAGIMYFKFKLFSLGKKLNLRHVVIDEAQDLSQFEFFIIN